MVGKSIVTRSRGTILANKYDRCVFVDQLNRPSWTGYTCLVKKNIKEFHSDIEVFLDHWRHWRFVEHPYWTSNTVYTVILYMRNFFVVSGYIPWLNSIQKTSGLLMKVINNCLGSKILKNWLWELNKERSMIRLLTFWFIYIHSRYVYNIIHIIF